MAKKEKDSIELKTGGLQTTDPAFADGGQEMDSMSNEPHPEIDEQAKADRASAETQAEKSDKK